MQILHICIAKPNYQLQIYIALLIFLDMSYRKTQLYLSTKLAVWENHLPGYDRQGSKI